MMTNISNLSNQTDDLSLIWVLPQIVTFIQLVITVSTYFLFVIYLFRKWKTLKKSIYLVLLAVSMLNCLLIRLLVNQTSIIVCLMSQTDKFQLLGQTLLDISSIMVAISFFPVYLFLWYRLKHLYSGSTLQHLNTRFLQFLKLIFFNIFVAGDVMLVIDSIYMTHVEISHDNCIKERQKHSLIHWAALVMLFVSHIALTILYLYPLFTENRFKADLKQFGIGNLLKRAAKDQRIIYITTFTNFLCLLSYVTMMIIDEFILPFGTFESIFNMFYDIGTFTNVMTLLISFKKFKKFSIKLVKCK